MSSLVDRLTSLPRARLIGIGAGAFAGVALVSAGIVMATRPTPPGLPASAQEAIAVMASARYDLLDAERKRQYMAETRRLMRELSDEERREMFENEALRDAMRETRQDMMDERAREFARTGEMPAFRPRGEGQGPPPGMRERFENMTEEEREAMREQRRQQMVDELAEQTASGNAQSSGLQQEMMKRMGGRRGGGGQRGGG